MENPFPPVPEFFANILRTKDWKEYSQHVLDTLVPMIRDSDMTLTLWSDAEPDAKQAIETGFSILLDKPLILLALRGVEIPEKLMRVADEIVWYERDKMDEVAPLIAEAQQRIGKRLRDG